MFGGGFMKYNFSKRVFSLLTCGTIVLCGCSSKKNKSEVDTSSFVSPVTTVSDDISDVVSTLSSSAIVTTTTNTSTTTTSSSTCTTTVIPTTEVTSFYSENDSVVLSYFDELDSNVKSSFDSSDFLDKGKFYFVSCVDFLFYDGEIKGVKFSELSDMAKQQLISDIITIDDLICSKFPNYKETISSNGSALYNKASDIIHSGSIKLSDYSREKLGEENYMKIKEYKDLFVEQTSQDWNEFTGIIGDGYDKGKSKVKEWYENFREGQ
jgi:hypothetical protein